jgi:hypothetical protein
LDQDLCPEDVAILPKKLELSYANAQSMNLLNALLQKPETHDIEEIYFNNRVMVGQDLLKAQEEVIHNIANRCPKLRRLSHLLTGTPFPSSP